MYYAATLAYLAIRKYNLSDFDKAQAIIGIASDSWYSYNYAAHVLKARFELGEKEISADGGFSFLYARDIIHGRFELGEKAITNSTYKHKYLEFIENLK